MQMAVRPRSSNSGIMDARTNWIGQQTTCFALLAQDRERVRLGMGISNYGSIKEIEGSEFGNGSNLRPASDAHLMMECLQEHWTEAIALG